jgi:UDP-glucose/iron transport system ATP-binding protein
MHSPLPEPQTGTHSNTPVLTFKNVSFTWPGGAGLHNVSFNIPQGQFVLISGASGSGKSTLLRLVVRLEEASGGEILLRGTPITSFYPPTLRAHIGFVQQQPTLVPGSVRQNLHYTAERTVCSQKKEDFFNGLKN